MCATVIEVRIPGKGLRGEEDLPSKGSSSIWYGHAGEKVQEK